MKTLKEADFPLGSKVVYLYCDTQNNPGHVAIRIMQVVHWHNKESFGLVEVKELDQPDALVLGVQAKMDPRVIRCWTVVPHANFASDKAIRAFALHWVEELMIYKGADLIKTITSVQEEIAELHGRVRELNDVRESYIHAKLSAAFK